MKWQPPERRTMAFPMSAKPDMTTMIVRNGLPLVAVFSAAAGVSLAPPSQHSAADAPPPKPMYSSRSFFF